MSIESGDVVPGLWLWRQRTGSGAKVTTGSPSGGHSRADFEAALSEPEPWSKPQGA